jgi:DNA polymerase III epsilon subunit-like protein
MSIPSYLLGDVLAFDTETALLGDKVCEIGFSLFRNAQLLNSWGTFVNPGIPIDPGATKVHNIYDKDVENAPTFQDLAWCIYNNLNSADVYVAYNFEYDRDVLGKEFARLGMKWPVKPMVDPFILFKQKHKFHKGKKLVNAAEKYGIKYVGAHRANNDAMATGQLLLKMAATNTSFPRSMSDILKKQRAWVEEQYIDLNNYFISKGKQPIDKPNYTFFEEVL